MHATGRRDSPPNSATGDHWPPTTKKTLHQGSLAPCKTMLQHDHVCRCENAGSPEPHVDLAAHRTALLRRFYPIFTPFLPPYYPSGAVFTPFLPPYYPSGAVFTPFLPQYYPNGAIFTPFLPRFYPPHHLTFTPFLPRFYPSFYPADYPVFTPFLPFFVG